MSQDKRKKQKYSAEFKQEAVELAEKVGSSEACKQLGIKSSTLYNWQAKARSQKGKTVSKDKPSYEELEKEVRRLRKEIGYIEEINEVLKKSTAIFSKSHLKNSK